MSQIPHRVVGNRVLLELDKVDPKNNKIDGSSFYAPEGTIECAPNQRTKAKVVGIGPGAYKDSTPWCEVGDVVHFARYGAVILESKPGDLKEYWVIRDIDVLTIARGERDE